MRSRIRYSLSSIYLITSSVLRQASVSFAKTTSSSSSSSYTSTTSTSTMSTLVTGSSTNTSTNTSPELAQWARQAIESAQMEFKDKPEIVDPNTNSNTCNLKSISIARHFLSKASPKFLTCPMAQDVDRLVKVGRSIADLVRLDLELYIDTDIDIDTAGIGAGDVDTTSDEEDGYVLVQKSHSNHTNTSTLLQGLAHVVESCNILSQITPGTKTSGGKSPIKVPKVRFGKTELQMPIVTLGTMRFQQTWGQSINDINEINARGQDNLLAILRHSIYNLGMNHIECARAYGSSELQLGAALQQLFHEDEDLRREDLIIQTKVGAMNPKDFRKTLEKSFECLQVDYVDLFSMHGINLEYHYDLVFGKDNNKDTNNNKDTKDKDDPNTNVNGDGEENENENENVMDIIKEYQQKGKIRHVGFSTHAQPWLIRKCIETGAFDYANLHYHAFGSYTASGGGEFGGNREIVRLLKEMDMGIFVISPFDKGGRLYAPSRKLRSLTLPEMEPIDYGSQWLFNHGELDEENAPVHTMTIGAARPSDLDEPAIAAFLHANVNANTTNREEMIKKVKIVSKRLYEAEVEALGEDWVKNWWVNVPNCDTVNDAYNFGQMVWLHNIVKAWGMLDFAKDRYAVFDGNLKKWDFDRSTRENIEKMRSGWGYCPGLAYEPGKDFSKYLEKVPEENREKVMEAIQFAFEHCSSSSDKSSTVVPSEWETAYDMRPWLEFPRQT